MQHQIVQSPARLGLTSSNSSPPRLPPQQKNPPLSATAPQPLLSPELLPLLPPLPRAQSLLHHLASIAAALFQASPKHPLWLASFRGSLPTFLSTPPAASPSSTADLLSLAASFQAHLSDAVSELQHILDAQDAHRRLQQQILATDASALSGKLREAERVLDTLLDDYSGHHVSQDGLRLADVLSYARRISYTTFAPPEFGADAAPLRRALPPAPQDEQMRASRLYSISPTDLGLPEAVEGERGEAEVVLMEVPVTVKEVAPVPAVPSGWRPGMPVELPGDMLPPAGWRPGDPVSLPPQAEEALVRHGRETEPIQVRHVQLDITLDQDDDSTDYSTDVESSEEDD